MKFLKNLALVLLSFLLFLSLSIFGLAFMVNSTALNPKFVTSELNRLDMSSLAGDIINEQVKKGELPKEFGTSLVNTIAKVEPSVKEKIGAATYSIYDYLLGKRQSPDLALTLRSSVLSTDFIVSIVDKLDTAPLAKEFLAKQVIEEIPEDMKYLAGYLGDATTELKPWIEEQIKAAADPTLDYLFGESRSLNIVVSLEPIKENLRKNVREAFLKSPPPELAGVPQAELEQYFNQFYQQFSAQVPSTFVINESRLGTDMPAKIAKALAHAEGQLEQARQFIAYFQLAYKALIGFMLLLVLGIVLINHQVKDTTRRIGIPLLTYGALWYASVFVGKYFAGTQLKLPEIPSSLQTWIPQFFDNLMAPLEMLSLGLLIGGIVLIIVSFVYKPRQA